VKLPPLPLEVESVYVDVDGLSTYREARDCYYTMDQMHAYAEQAVREALVHAFNELNDLFLETLKARVPGEDLDNNDEQFNIGMCAQALGISRCQHVVQSLIRPQDPPCSPTSSTGQSQ